MGSVSPVPKVDAVALLLPGVESVSLAPPEVDSGSGPGPGPGPGPGSAPLIGIAEDEVQISNITATGEPPRNNMDQPFIQTQALVPSDNDQHLLRVKSSPRPGRPAYRS